MVVNEQGIWRMVSETSKAAGVYRCCGISWNKGTSDDSCAVSVSSNRNLLSDPAFPWPLLFVYVFICEASVGHDLLIRDSKIIMMESLIPNKPLGMLNS